MCWHAALALFAMEAPRVCCALAIFLWTAAGNIVNHVEQPLC
jgi:hypothetical protein